MLGAGGRGGIAASIHPSMAPVRSRAQWATVRVAMCCAAGPPMFVVAGTWMEESMTEMSAKSRLGKMLGFFLGASRGSSHRGSRSRGIAAGDCPVAAALAARLNSWPPKLLLPCHIPTWALSIDRPRAPGPLPVCARRIQQVYRQFPQFNSSYILPSSSISATSRMPLHFPRSDASIFIAHSRNCLHCLP